MDGKMYPGIKKIHCCFFIILHKTSFSFVTTSHILSERSPRTPLLPFSDERTWPQICDLPKIRQPSNGYWGWGGGADIS